MNNILSLKNLDIKIDKKNILNNININVKPGECIAILGQNGEGKSTILKTIMGHYATSVGKGEIVFKDKIINELKSFERSNLGIFLINQNPIEIEGLKTIDFYKSILNAKGTKLKTIEFYKIIEANLKLVNLNQDILERDFNLGFSGGEKKRNEIMQMLLLDPQLILVDEIDSGLDVDSFKIIIDILKKELKKGKTLIIVSHNKELIKQLQPNKIYLLANQTIVHKGDYEFAMDIMENGFKKILNKLGIKNQDKKILGTCIGEHFAKK